MHDRMKKAAAKKAAELIQDSMIIGLGTGSTATFFIEALKQRIKEGLKIEAAIPSSKQSEEIAKKENIPTLDIDQVSHIDVTIDGADEIDDQKRMIKGGGGALLREKILASSSQEMWVIVDETKLSQQLGSQPLPVEVLFYGHKMTQKKIEKKQLQGSFRSEKNGNFFFTDNGNLIFDIHFLNPIKSPEEIHHTLIEIPGVIETGFFFNLSKKIIVGKADQSIELMD